MSTNWRTSVRDDSLDVREPLPQDDFADEVLVAEVEPKANGQKRALIYPAGAPGHEVATQWLAADMGALVNLDDAR